MARTSAAEKTAAGKGAAESPTPSAKVADRDIERRAYELYLARGYEPGHEVEDWLSAESDLQTTS